MGYPWQWMWEYVCMCACVYISPSSHVNELVSPQVLYPGPCHI